MRSMFASYLSAWKSSDGASSWAAPHVALTLLAAGSLAALLEPRTFLGRGFDPHPQWALPLVAWVLLLVVSAAPTAVLPDRRIWRSSPLLLALIPAAPLTFRIALALAAAAGLISWSR